ncbi:MAG: hypothetical protein GY861_27280 [bacterium]|nr:hypothetical protein [bacterium]
MDVTSSPSANEISGQQNIGLCITSRIFFWNILIHNGSLDIALGIGKSGVIIAKPFAINRVRDAS